MAKAETKNERLSITPLGDRVVVKPQAKEETSAMGIIIPDSAKQDAPSKGTVVAVGAGRYDDGDLLPMTVKIGDTVLFSKYGYDEVKVDGQEYYILSESNVLAVLS
ncbi:MAG TPA: co-chaperone GroES [Candidatus Paceibacterota bacterium]|jgi:chaperonin GroES|nr:co-chaperone GroES [Candidatus Paceibacterota bacterium]